MKIFIDAPPCYGKSFLINELIKFHDIDSVDSNRELLENLKDTNLLFDNMVSFISKLKSVRESSSSKITLFDRSIINDAIYNIMSHSSRYNNSMLDIDTMINSDYYKTLLKIVTEELLSINDDICCIFLVEKLHDNKLDKSRYKFHFYHMIKSMGLDIESDDTVSKLINIYSSMMIRFLEDLNKLSFGRIKYILKDKNTFIKVVHDGEIISI